VAVKSQAALYKARLKKLRTVLNRIDDAAADALTEDDRLRQEQNDVLDYSAN